MIFLLDTEKKTISHIYKYVSFLGWNPGTEKEVYSIDELISDFSLKELEKVVQNLIQKSQMVQSTTFKIEIKFGTCSKMKQNCDYNVSLLYLEKVAELMKEYFSIRINFGKIFF